MVRNRRPLVPPSSGARLLGTVSILVPPAGSRREAKRSPRHHRHRSHQADEKSSVAVAVVTRTGSTTLSGIGHSAAVGLVFSPWLAINRELRRRDFWSVAGRKRT